MTNKEMFNRIFAGKVYGAFRTQKAQSNDALIGVVGIDRGLEGCGSVDLETWFNWDFPVMTNADRIRAMNDDELASFLFFWQVNLISEVFSGNGFKRMMNYADLKRWMADKAQPHPIFEKGFSKTEVTQAN